MTRAAAGSEGAQDAAAAAVAAEEEEKDEEADGGVKETKLRFFGLEGDELEANVDALKAADIKAELKVFGVGTTGLKAQLVERLTECYRLTVRFFRRLLLCCC